MDDESQEPIPVWDFDRLEPLLFKKEMYKVAGFVEWLSAREVEVPACWYVHGWLRDRLAAFLAWRGEWKSGADAARWWSDLAAFEQSKAWQTALHHGGFHSRDGSDTPTPKFADVVRDLVGAKAAATQETVDAHAS